MNKITKEQAKEWLGIVQSGLIGREYRDVFLRLPEILQSYLAQGEELERKDRLIKMQDGFITEKSTVAAERSTRISQLEVELDQLEAETQALKNEEDRLRSGFQRTIDDLSRTIDVLQAENQALKRKGELLCCQVGVMEMENQALKGEVVRLSESRIVRSYERESIVYDNEEDTRP